MSSVGEVWDRRFTEQRWPSDPNPFLIELADPLPAGRALDLGSGPGRNSLWLAARGWAVTAVDASQVALTQAIERGADLGVSIDTVHADVTTWQPRGDRYDLVVLAYLHPGGDDLAAVLAAAADALVPDGHLFVVGHDLASHGRHGPPDAARLLTPERLAAAMPPQVTLELLERRTRPAGCDAEAGAGANAPADVTVLAWGSRRR